MLISVDDSAKVNIFSCSLERCRLTPLCSYLKCLFPEDLHLVQCVAGSFPCLWEKGKEVHIGAIWTPPQGRFLWLLKAYGWGNPACCWCCCHSARRMWALNREAQRRSVNGHQDLWRKPWTGWRKRHWELKLIQSKDLCFFFVRGFIWSAFNIRLLLFAQIYSKWRKLPHVEHSEGEAAVMLQEAERRVFLFEVGWLLQ